MGDEPASRISLFAVFLRPVLRLVFADDHAPATSAPLNFSVCVDNDGVVAGNLNCFPRAYD
jgi:hypothetical protein